MAHKVTARTILNHSALDELRRGLADGMAAIGEKVIETARPHVPDAPPIGKGLVETGDWGVWVDGKKVAGTATKPRREPAKDGIVLFAGYDFPGRFLEEGTIYITPRPWVTPAVLEVMPDKDGILAEKFK
jgi:hypothetical protein